MQGTVGVALSGLLGVILKTNRKEEETGTIKQKDGLHPSQTLSVFDFLLFLGLKCSEAFYVFVCFFSFSRSLNWKEEQGILPGTEPHSISMCPVRFSGCLECSMLQFLCLISEIKYTSVVFLL